MRDKGRFLPLVLTTAIALGGCREAVPVESPQPPGEVTVFSSASTPRVMDSFEKARSMEEVMEMLKRSASFSFEAETGRSYPGAVVRTEEGLGILVDKAVKTWGKRRGEMTRASVRTLVFPDGSNEDINFSRLQLVADGYSIYRPETSLESMRLAPLAVAQKMPDEGSPLLIVAKGVMQEAQTKKVSYGEKNLFGFSVQSAALGVLNEEGAIIIGFDMGIPQIYGLIENSGAQPTRIDGQEMFVQVATPLFEMPKA